MSDWHNKKSVQKADIAERIVHEYLESLGFIVYVPKTDAGHPFDRLAATRDKQEIMIVEVKAKAKRNFYPDTGIDEEAYNNYKHISNEHHINCFIFFVDEFSGKIYGNSLDELEKPTVVEHNGKKIHYPLKQQTASGKTIIYFPLDNMKTIGVLTDVEKAKLKQLSNRSYEYPEDGK